MESIATEQGVHLVRLDSLSREISPLDDLARGSRTRPHHPPGAPADPAHAHGQGGHRRPRRRAAGGRGAAADRRAHLPRTRPARLLLACEGALRPPRRAAARPRDDGARRGEPSGARRARRTGRRAGRALRGDSPRHRPRAARSGRCSSRPAPRGGARRRLGGADDRDQARRGRGRGCRAPARAGRGRAPRARRRRPRSAHRPRHGHGSSASPSTCSSPAPVAEMGPWYRAFDVFLLPSANEGTPVAAIESLAAGTPVVASRVGGVPDVVREGEDGFLVDAGDVDGVCRSPRAARTRPGATAADGRGRRPARAGALRGRAADRRRRPALRRAARRERPRGAR